MDSLLVGLVDLEFGSGLGNKDDPIFFISLDGSSFITVGEGDLSQAFTSTGKKAGYVDLSKLTNPALAGNPDVSVLITHESLKHYEVNSLTYEAVVSSQTASGGAHTPEPLTMLGVLAATGATARYLRRRQK